MRKLFAGVLAAAAMSVTLLSGTATASGEVGVAGVGNQVCDYGEACLFAWPNWDGPTWDANGCGWHILDGWMQNQTSSVRAHGNAITLWDWNHGTNQWHKMTTVQAWESLRLVGSNDRTDAITVHC
ncbi:hypothetical protein ACFORH_09215 [Amycolatopsis roodepoortensis]|uniref:Peptidase inhibitor family I36 n=1 Tax=Amycolatopsis roodepoortensis TaxID=700274 RepID=A0ABR9LAI7_9PSEU|nr:hypothetical protein [Amycolatopsis roodepoortensis]MBE1577347.1 hypothetical protein [Amycolatopsis roodepoortensis]